MSQSRRFRSERKKTDRSLPSADRQRKQKMNWNLDLEKILALFFLAATIAGLYLTLTFVLAYPLTSDMANAGLFVMEAMHGNFEYVFPANNPYIFTDYIVHMVIQPLTGYSPLALVLTGYAMYILTVLACAALVLRLAGRIEALAAAALVANMPAAGLRYVVYPLYHNGTILFILLSLLVFYAYRPPFRLSVRWRVSIVAMLQLLGVFSDTLMLPVFTLPLIVYSAFRLWKQSRVEGASKKDDETEGSPVLWLASAVPAIIIYALKSRIGRLWPGGPILDPGADIGGLGSLLRHPEMVSDYIIAMSGNTGGIIVGTGILLLVLIVVLERKERFLQAILAFGAVFMLIGFMSMTMAGDPARYLTPVSILALAVAATGTMAWKRTGIKYLPLIAIIAIILINVWSNVVVLSEIDRDYKAPQEELVAYLESKNITHAYSDYWSANVYTYMSGGKVMIEPVIVQDDRLQFQTMNSAPRWREVWPDGNDTEPVILTSPGDSLYDWTQKVNKNHTPVATYQLMDSRIYVYNGTLPAWPA